MPHSVLASTGYCGTAGRHLDDTHMHITMGLLLEYCFISKGISPILTSQRYKRPLFVYGYFVYLHSSYLASTVIPLRISSIYLCVTKFWKHKSRTKEACWRLNFMVQFQILKSSKCIYLKDNSTYFLIMGSGCWWICFPVLPILAGTMLSAAQLLENQFSQPS